MISCGSGCLPMSCHHTSAYPVRPKARRTRGTNRPAWRLIVKGSVRDACGSNRRWHTCRDLRAPHVKVLVALARVVRVEARGALSRAATHDVLAVHVARRRRPRRPQPQEPGQSHHVPHSAPSGAAAGGVLRRTAQTHGLTPAATRCTSSYLVGLSGASSVYGVTPSPKNGGRRDYMFGNWRAATLLGTTVAQTVATRRTCGEGPVGMSLCPAGRWRMR